MDWLRFHPAYWIQNYPTSLSWDRELSEAMAQGDISILSDYSARVGPFKVWTGNFPYAYGHRYDGPHLLPRASTRKKLRQAILEAEIAKDRAHGL